MQVFCHAQIRHSWGYASKSHQSKFDIIIYFLFVISPPLSALHNRQNTLSAELFEPYCSAIIKFHRKLLLKFRNYFETTSDSTIEGDLGQCCTHNLAASTTASWTHLSVICQSLSFPVTFVVVSEQCVSPLCHSFSPTDLFLVPEHRSGRVCASQLHFSK